MLNTFLLCLLVKGDEEVADTMSGANSYHVKLEKCFYDCIMYPLN